MVSHIGQEGFNLLGRGGGGEHEVLAPWTMSFPQCYSQVAASLLTFFLSQGSGSDLVSQESKKGKAKKRGSRAC